MASTLARSESSGFLLIGMPMNPCTAPFVNEEASQHRIVDPCVTNGNNPVIFDRTRRSKMSPVELCIESLGGHFEHLF
jgi:hypothetical protein